MKRKTIRLMSCVLAAVMLLGLAPLGSHVYAEGGAEQTVEKAEPLFADTDVAAIGQVGYPTLQAAVDAAVEGDEIRLLKSVEETVLIVERSIVLDLSSFTVSGNDSGSAITVSGGTVELKNGAVSDSVAQVKGGGVHIKDGAVVTMTGVTVRDNQCLNSGDSASGGGVCVEAGSKAELYGCAITDNKVKGGGWRLYSYGAGVYAEDGAEVSLNDCVISGNRCESGGSYINTYGAGLCLVSGAKAQLDNCTISGNVCATSSGRGGGLYIASGASAVLNDCTISGNSVNSKFGGAVYTEGSIVLSGGSVMENSVSGNGWSGAIFGEEDCSIAATNVLFSGHPRCAVYCDDGGSKTVKLTGCTFRASGTENYHQVRLLGQMEAELDGCTFSNAGCALGTNALYGNTIALTVKNSTFSGNTTASGSIIEIGMNTAAVLENCEISDNRVTGTSANDAVVKILDNASGAAMTGCGISGNELGDGSTIIAQSKLTLTDTVVSDNHAGCVGGIQITRGGSVEMTDSVVKNNVAKGTDRNKTSDSEGSAGGIAVTSYGAAGSLIFHSGAIYDNEQLVSYTGEDKANDVFVQGKSPNTGGRVAAITVDIPASQMEDGDMDFSLRKWKDEHSAVYEEKPAQTNDDHRYYTIMEEIDEYVAQVGEVQFKTIQEAIDAAQNGDTVILIAERQIVSTDALSIDKDLTFDFCSRRLRLSSLSGGGVLFTIAGGAHVTFRNSEDESYADGGILRGSTAVESGSSLTVADAMAVTAFAHNGDALTFHKRLDRVIDIALGDDCFVTLGEDWKNGVDYRGQGFRLTLSAADIAAVNAGGADHKIVENGDEALLRAVTVTGLTNGAVKKVLTGSDIVLRQSGGVYLSSSGSDSNDGASPDKPVKTFARAKALLLQNPDADGICIVGMVIPAANEVWEMPAGEARPVYRYKQYFGNMIYVSNGDFTLKNIILDGNKAQMNAAATSMIKVYGGTLFLEEGAELRNNNAANPDVPYNGQHLVHGGAVLCESSMGRIVMNGGRIHGNEAFMGGGIFAGNGYYSGDGKKLVMNGGVIENNHAVYYDELSRKFNANANATGGGVMLAFGAYMDMNGGEIRGNVADSWGGGVCLGNNNDYYSKPGAYETYQQRRVTLNMHGGSIAENTASTGGGIFVQCDTIVNLYEGVIEKNAATERSVFPRGGGVYVNGRHGSNGIIDGFLYIHSPVEMAGNTADYQGDAIMTCATSLTFLRDLLGAAIHDNGTGGDQVAFTAQSESTQGLIPMRLHSYLSEFMPGGGEYDWMTGSGTPADHSMLRDVTMPVAVTSHKGAGTPEMDAALALVRVRINDNHTASGGGAIGNNGSVFVGEYLTRVDVHLVKEWADDDAADLRPESVTVVLTRGEGDERADVMEAVLTPDSNGVWEHTFANLPRYRIDPDTGLETAEEIVYGVREKAPITSADVEYESTVTENPASQRPANESVDPAAPTDPIRVRHFTVTNTLVKKVSLRYDPNEGEGDMSDKSYFGPYTTELKAEENKYARPGFLFTGWNTEPGGGGVPYQPGDEIVFTAPEMVLYAQWVMHTEAYTVAYYYQKGGRYADEADSAETRPGQVGSSVGVTDGDKIPVKAGYVFDESAGNVLEGEVTADGSLVLKVYFKQQFTVVYDPGEHGTWDPKRETTAALDYGADTPAFSGDTESECQPGYIFAGWDKSLADTVTEDVTYTARWKAEESSEDAPYTVEYHYQTNGKYAEAPEDYAVRAGRVGDTVGVTDGDKVPVKEGYIFDESAGNVLEGEVTADGSLVLKVYFKQQLTITFDPNGGELGGSDNKVVTVHDYGEEITILDKPERAGYTFLYWRGSEYYPGQSYVVTEDHTFVAQWEEDEGGDPSPTTGDDAAPMRWIAWMALAVTGLAGLLLLERRRKGLGG